GAAAEGVAVVAGGEEIGAAPPRLRLLVNNAGIALGGRFDQVTLAQYEEVIDVNFRAVVRVTHTLLPAPRAQDEQVLDVTFRAGVRLTHPLLPALRAEPGAHLVTVSSLFGLVAPAG